jgi:hypothetical protein
MKYSGNKIDESLFGEDLMLKISLKQSEQPVVLPKHIQCAVMKMQQTILRVQRQNHLCLLRTDYLE